MMSQPSYETIAIHILLKNISSKSNQGIRFGELIEYSRKNVGDKLFPDTFLRNQNWIYIIFIQFVFIVC